MSLLRMSQASIKGGPGARDISGVHPLAILGTSALGSLDADDR